MGDGLRRERSSIELCEDMVGQLDVEGMKSYQRKHAGRPES